MSVRIRGLDEVQALVRRIEKGQGLDTGLEEAGHLLKSKLATYPPQRSRPQPFKTDKSRRFFFAALRRGDIQAPYRRGTSPGSQTAGRRWTVVRRSRRVVIGNNASYAPLLWGRRTQARYHRAGGWRTIEQVYRENAGQVERIIFREIVKDISRGGR